MVMWEEGRLVFKDVWMFWGNSARVLAAGEKFFRLLLVARTAVSSKGLLVSYLILHFEGVKSWLFPLWVVDIFKSASFVEKKYNFVRFNIGDEFGKNCVGDTEDRLIGM